MVAHGLWWSVGKSLAFSVVWWSYGKSLGVSVIVRWLPVAPRRFKPAPRALLRLSGGPTATLSRFPWSGGPTVNLSRFPSLGWSCVQSLVFLWSVDPTVNLSRFPSLGWSCGKSLVLSGVLVVPRQLSHVFRGLVVLR